MALLSEGGYGKHVAVAMQKHSYLFAAEANHRHHCRGFLIGGSLHALPSQLYQPQTIFKAAHAQSVDYV